MNKVQRLILTAILITLGGCSSKPSSSNYDVPPKLDRSQQVTTQAYLEVYDEWKGVPYHLGGNSFSGIDCSAFVQVAVRNATQQQLPRTTALQSKQGQAISYNQAVSGDLVFFRTTQKSRHVGVYLGNKHFLHASTSKGVIISRLDNPYWASKFWHFRRL